MALIEGLSKPTKEQLATETLYTAYKDAERAKDWIETFHEIGGLVVVHFDEWFYVVYGDEYSHGYKT